MVEKLHRHRFGRRLCVVLVVMWLCGCAAQRNSEATLYEKLGGEPGVAELVDRLLIRIIEDPAIAYTFAEVNVARLRQLLEEQFCEVSDGPCEYSGYSMLESHRGMQITDAEFNAIVEDLIQAMEDVDLPVATQNQFLARLTPMHRDIVYR